MSLRKQRQCKKTHKNVKIVKNNQLSCSAKNVIGNSIKNNKRRDSAEQRQCNNTLSLRWRAAIMWKWKSLPTGYRPMKLLYSMRPYTIKYNLNMRVCICRRRLHFKLSEVPRDLYINIVLFLVCYLKQTNVQHLKLAWYTRLNFTTNWT